MTLLQRFVAADIEAARALRSKQTGTRAAWRIRVAEERARYLAKQLAELEGRPLLDYLPSGFAHAGRA